MAMIPLGGVGGTLFAGGGGGGGTGTPSPLTAPGGIHAPGQGKNSVQQNLSSPHSGLRQTITPGEPMSRAMGQYGKGHSFNLAGSTFGASPLSKIRGGIGQMRRIRGGLGPGKFGQPGGKGDYSMKSGDAE